MDKIRILHFVCGIIIFVLVSLSWQIENEKVVRIILGVVIELTFVYASFYGGTMG